MFNNIFRAIKNILSHAESGLRALPTILAILDALHSLEASKSTTGIEAATAELLVAVADLAKLGVPAEHIYGLRDAIIAITEDLRK